ncbi:hypothetical protein L5515_002176 [Caenorhabditis briggsae]|uniref:Uncharacterized protein n=1 Tax=Caenorhabditis briggsae TaxID=6238 RepID=A0AAE9E5U0_CAEBR|nr:hypothetical protein L5515_002176 [Caenorhabditis briggsae]
MNSTVVNSTLKILNDTINELNMEEVTIWEATSLGFMMRVIYVLSILVMFLGIIWIYEWVQSTKASEQSITPTIPFEEEELTVYNGDHGEKFYCGYTDVGQRKNRSMNTLREILEMVYETRLRDYGEFLQDARIISIKMPGFENGVKCHEFVLKTGTMSSGSGFTYQMYGDNAIQVTRLNENGVGYIAGFCIYIRMEYEWGIRFRKAFIREILESRRYGRPVRSRRYLKQRSLRDAPETENLLSCTIPTHTWKVSYCEKRGRDVMSAMDSGLVIHQEWDTMEEQMETRSCMECSRAHNAPPPSYSSIIIV